MRTFVPAFLERMVPRVFSAALMLLVAALTSPYQVGVYSWATLVYTAAQATLDTAARQVIIRVVTEPAGRDFLRRYRRIAPTVACAIMLLTILTLRLTHVATSWSMAGALLPFAFAPFFTAWGLWYVGILQATERWRPLARGQLVASAISVAVAIPVLLVTHSLLGPSLQTLVAEAAFAWWARRSARHLRRAPGNTPDPILPKEGASSIAHDAIGMGAYGLLAWAQGQAERVFLGVLAGPAPLGIYSTANTIGRAPGDALGASTANIVRTAVARNESASEIRETMERTMLKTLALAFGAPVSACALAAALWPLLGPDWHPALRVVPILSISAFPSVMSWAASVLQMKAGQASRSIWAPILGIAFGALIGLVAAHSLMLACYVVLLREISVVTLAFGLARRYAPWRSYWICLGIVGVLATASFLVLV